MSSTIELTLDDLEPTTYSLTYKDVHYVLKTATGEEASVYQNAVAASTIFDNKGVPCGVKNLGALPILIVSLCLKRADAPTVRLSTDVISTWPNPIVQRLAEKALAISGLSKSDEPPKKNELALTEDGSV